MATFDGVKLADHEEVGVRREARATMLYEDDRGIGTCSNTLRITWFGQRHLTSTLKAIIAQLSPAQIAP